MASRSASVSVSASSLTEDLQKARAARGARAGETGPVGRWFGDQLGGGSLAGPEGLAQGVRGGGSRPRGLLVGGFRNGRPGVRVRGVHPLDFPLQGFGVL